MKHKPGSTSFLKVVVVLIGVAALAVCIFGLPEMASRDAAAHPDKSYQQYIFLTCAYILAIPFFVALFQAFKLLGYIDKNLAYSELSVNVLRVIKLCAGIISILFVAGMIFIMIMSNGKEDIAGIIGMGLMITFASSVIATIAAVLQKLFKKAIAIKSENDLTV